MARRFHTGWVAQDGSFGFGNIVIFDFTEITGLEWHELADAADSDKMRYVTTALGLTISLKEELEAEGYKFGDFHDNKPQTSKYVVKVARHYDYEVPVEALDPEWAREIVRNYDIEELEPYETNAYFDFEFGEEPNDNK